MSIEFNIAPANLTAEYIRLRGLTRENAVLKSVCALWASLHKLGLTTFGPKNSKVLNKHCWPKKSNNFAGVGIPNCSLVVLRMLGFGHMDFIGNWAGALGEQSTNVVTRYSNSILRR